MSCVSLLGHQVNKILENWHVVAARGWVVTDEANWCFEHFGNRLCYDFDIEIADGRAHVDNRRAKGDIDADARWEMAEDSTDLDMRFVFRDERDAVLFKLAWG